MRNGACTKQSIRSASILQVALLLINNIFLTNSFKFLSVFGFPASEPLLKGTKKLRSLGKQAKTRDHHLLASKKVNTVVGRLSHTNVCCQNIKSLFELLEVSSATLSRKISKVLLTFMTLPISSVPLDYFGRLTIITSEPWISLFHSLVSLLPLCPAVHLLFLIGETLFGPWQQGVSCGQGENCFLVGISAPERNWKVLSREPS